jgi:hypothetical protein
MVLACRSCTVSKGEMNDGGEARGTNAGLLGNIEDNLYILQASANHVRSQSSSPEICYRWLSRVTYREELTTDENGEEPLKLMSRARSLTCCAKARSEHDQCLTFGTEMPQT